MRVRSSLLIAALLSAGLLGPLAHAQSPLREGPLDLFLSAATGNLEGVGEVATLSPTPPPAEGPATNTSVSGNGTSWYALPAAGVEFALNGTVNGTIFFQSVLQSQLVIGTLVHDVDIELRKRSGNASEATLGSAAVSISFVQNLLQNQAQSQSVSWAFNVTNTSVLPGEVLLLHIQSMDQVPATTLDVLYGNATYPSRMHLEPVRVARGNVALFTTQAGREAAPGSSATYAITVRNLADVEDTVRLEATGTPATWSILLNTAEMTLAAGGAGSLLVTVSVPQDARAGDQHVATVRATSALGAPPATLSLSTRAGTAVAPGPADGDKDGWSDVEERRYSSSPTDPLSTPTTEDSDGDGVSNKDEVDGGTDPFNAADFPGSSDRRGGTGTAGGTGRSALAPLSDPIADALGVSSETADIIALLLILLLFLLILFLLWLLLGGYPVKLVMVEPRAATAPGQPVDYTVEVRSRIRRNQSVDLETAQLPGDWEVRFTRPRFTLGAKAVETVGLLVRPPGSWPAPSKREFEVRARSRLKPRSFARAKGKLDIEHEATPVQEEEGFAEPRSFEAEPETERAYAAPPSLYAPPEVEPPGTLYVPPPPPTPPGFEVRVRDVRHDPPVPVRGGEVSTTAVIDDLGSGPEKLRVLLVVNGKIRDEVTTDLAPGESVEAQFRWTAYLARNEVKVVAERTPA